MARLEVIVQKKLHRVKIQQQLTLAFFRMTASSSLAFAPDAVLLRHFDPEYTKKGSPSHRMYQAVQRLEQRGILKRKRGAKGWHIELTSKGKQQASKLEAAQHIRISKPATWDGKWRMVIFDIWERRRVVRDKLRRALARAGFLKIQNSVWIYPYDCEELVAFLRTDLHLGKSILYIIADGIEHDERYQAHFNI
ncbi:MAG: hypothetical protein Q7R71_00735 [bacterium]|nr:hypothetical protein [bacterium]